MLAVAEMGSVSISLLDYNAESHLLASKRSLRQAERAQRIAEKSRIRSYLCESLPACRPFRYIEMVNESLRQAGLRPLRLCVRNYNQIEILLRNALPRNSSGPRPSEEFWVFDHKPVGIDQKIGFESACQAFVAINRPIRA